MFFLSLIDDAYGLIRTLFAKVTDLLYQLVVTLYNLFIAISKISLYDSSEASAIFKRFELLLSIIMIFYVSFQFVKYIVNPDVFSEKEKGFPGLAKRLVIIVVLMAFMTQIFETIDKVKRQLIDDNVVPHLITSDVSSIDGSNDEYDPGGVFAAHMLENFYKVTPGKEGKNCEEGGFLGIGDTSYKIDKVIENRIEYIKYGYNKKIKNIDKKDPFVSSLSACIDDYDEGIFLIDVNWILIFGLAIFSIWIFINYCVEAAKMVFQIFVLQIIAPIPIMCYISPDKDGTFQKWVKLVISTYLDFFLRLFIIYMMMFFSTKIFNAFDSWDRLTNGSNISAKSFSGVMLKAFLIIGLLYFAMQAPKLLKELLPKGMGEGSFGLGGKSFKDRFNPSARLAGAGLGGARRLKKGASKIGNKAKDNWKQFGNPFSKQGLKNRHNARTIASAAKKAARVERRRAKKDAREAMAEERKKYGEELADAAKQIREGKGIPEGAIKDRLRGKEKELANIKKELEGLDAAERSGLSLSTEQLNRRDDLRAKAKQLAYECDMIKNHGYYLNSETANINKSIESVNKIKSEAKDKMDNADSILNNPNASQEAKDKAKKDKAQAEIDYNNAERAIKKLETIKSSKQAENDNITAYTNAIEDVNTKKKELADAKVNAKSKMEAYEKIKNDNSKSPAEKELARAEAEAAKDNVQKCETDFASSKDKLEAAKKPFETMYKGSTLKPSDIKDINKGVSDARDRVNAARGELSVAESNYAKARHEALETWNGGAIGTTAKEIGLAAGGGLLKDMVHGAKTKEITKVIPNFVSDIAKDVQTEAKREEWVAQGGNDTFIDNVSRTFANVGHKYIGGTTGSQASMNAIKPLETEIEGNKSAISVADKAISSIGSLKDTATKKREGGKFFVKLDGDAAEDYRDELGKIKTTDGRTLSKVLTDEGKSLASFKSTKELTDWITSRSSSYTSMSSALAGKTVDENAIRADVMSRFKAENKSVVGPDFDKAVDARIEEEKAKIKNDQNAASDNAIIWQNLSSKLVSDISKRDLSRYYEKSIRDNISGAELEKEFTVDADISTGMRSMYTEIQSMLSNDAFYEECISNDSILTVLDAANMSISDLAEWRHGVWPKNADYMFCDTLSDKLKEVKSKFDTRNITISQQVADLKSGSSSMKIQETGPEKPSGGSDGGKK